MMTPLTIVTYNVRSLGQGKQGVKKRCDIRNYLKKADPKPDVLLLQETHMGIRDCMASTSQLHHKGGMKFWNEAKYSATTGKYIGGTSILVAEHLASLIEDHGVLIDSRAQYVTIRFSTHIKIGIVNIYGYNQPLARAHMWQTLAQHELPEADWIWAGDWNMVELEGDRSTAFTGTTLCRSERSIWSEFLMA